MSFYFNPLDKNTKSIIGAVSNKENLILKVFTNNSYAKLIIKNHTNGNESCLDMIAFDSGFLINLNCLEIGLYYYYFESDNTKYYQNSEMLAENVRGEEFQLLVYDSSYKVPNLNGGIIYQIFPDRFYRKGKNFSLAKNKVKKNWGDEPNYLPNENGKILNNDFYGGNFLGIIDKLDYLKSLGVTLIYLNPISLAYSNHRYDTANYFEIDPVLGSKEEFKLLINKAHEKGIKIMLDGVYNHTGDDSVYFNKYGNYNEIGAYESKDSKYYDWYEFKNYPNKYKCWWDIDILPAINKSSKSFWEYIAGKNGVISHYMNLGVDGFRLDVVDELSSPFVKKIRKAIKSVNSEGIVLGEVWEDATNKIAYNEQKEYFLGKELDSVMNYPLKDAIISYILTKDAKVLSKVIKTQINNYPKKSLDILMNILGTHDTARILTVLTGVDTNITRYEAVKVEIPNELISVAKNRLKMATVLLYTLYGLPTIYYGDERGMLGFKDPFNRKCINWSKGNSEIEFYKTLGKIRKSEKVFLDGELEILNDKNGAIIFKRKKAGEEVIVAVNLGEYQYTFKSENGLKNLFTNEIKNKFILEKEGFLILKP